MSQIVLNTLPWLVFIIGGYLLGSVLFCQILAEKLCKKDLQKTSEDHNPGAANLYWKCGIWVGGLGLFLDILKGFLPVFVARLVLGTDSLAFALVMLAPVLGHAWSVFDHFKGGKCISTSFGVTLALVLVSPIFFIFGLLFILFSTIAKIKFGNTRALVVFLLTAVGAIVSGIILQQLAITVGMVLICIVAILKHRPFFESKKHDVRKAGA